MLYLHSALLTEGIDPIEPTLNSVEQLNVLAHTDKLLAQKRYALVFGYLHHRVHIGENAVHVLAQP